MSIERLARPEIRALRPYAAAEQLADTIRLNANESPLVPANNRFRRPLNRYPELRPLRLQKLLAERFGCASEQLLVTRGSSEAIDLLVRTFCRADKDSVLATSPSFSMYQHYASVQGAQFVEVDTSAENDYTIDIAAMLAACSDTTPLIFLCSPNNPTGNTLPRHGLERLLRERGDASAIVVDEAYVEFSTATSVVELMEQYPNLLVLRTLSKALAFAGARCGAVVGPPGVIRILSAVQSPYAMATPVVECVEDALQHNQLESAASAVATIVAERQRLMKAMASFNFVRKVWPSDANFFLIKVADADKVMRCCREHRVLLRQFGDRLPNCIRISVGSAADNSALLRALETLREY